MHEKYGNKSRKSVPTRVAFKNLVKKFKKTRSIKVEVYLGRLPIAPDVEQRVQETVTRILKSSPGRLTL